MSTRAALLPPLSHPLATLGAGLGIAAAAALAGGQIEQRPMLLAAALVLVVVAGTALDPRLGLGALAFATILSPELGGAVSVRADDVILAAAVFGWLARQAVRREPLRENPLLLPMALLAVAGLAAMAVAFAAGNIDPFRGQETPLVISALSWLKRLEYFAIVFLVAQTLKSRVEVAWFAGLLLVASVIVAARGAIVVARDGGQTGFRLSAPFNSGGANTLGEYHTLALALALGLLLGLRSARLRLALLGVLALNAYAFLYTFSRGSYIALVAVVLVLALLRDARLLLLVGALAFVLPAYLPADVTARVESIPHEIATVNSSNIGNNAFLARVDSYRVAALQVARRPPLGYGPGVVALDRIESQYAKEAVDGGLVGLTLFLWLLWRLARFGRRVLCGARDRLERGIGLGYLAGLAGMAVAGLGSIPFTTIRTMVPFCLATGLMVVLWRLQQEQNGEGQAA
ncbi:O-antigen ligase-like membrane protein [Gaiella occulta]|uniref:O-antigen ligase-like membrane protein n=1 Tax=Gaiella occulta TaxID=1002870 RepID=A0A7M2Z1H2_9ACTN|nr:O-antigen ligase family protein [Gaiella occulta]RDI76266.1 O-antigen ligase-like membrane protein [Gaiella occulta]